MDIKSFNERQTDISEIPYNEESTRWAVYYEHADDIEWKIVFREKTIEDIEVDLF